MAFDRRRLLQASTAAALSAPFISRRGFAANEPIKVGSLLDQSGPIGTSGTPMYYAAQVAVSEINAAGGVLGRPLKLVHYDTQSTIQLYSQYAQELALKDKVSVVQGGITSASREAIRPVFDRYKILYFYNVLYEGGVCDRDIFCTGTTPAQTVNKLVAYAQKTWGKNAYIVAADYNYGQITAKWMTKYTQDGGGKVLATDSSRSTFPISPPPSARSRKPSRISCCRRWSAPTTPLLPAVGGVGHEEQDPDRLDHVRSGQRTGDDGGQRKATASSPPTAISRNSTPRQTRRSSRRSRIGSARTSPTWAN